MNKEIEKILEIKEDCDYKRLSIEDILLLKEYITKLQQCYCNRTDCSARIKDSKKYDSLQQRIDKAIKYIRNTKHYEWRTERNERGNLNCEKVETTLVSGLKLLDILEGSDKE